jgi:hypothetical protein
LQVEESSKSFTGHSERVSPTIQFAHNRQRGIFLATFAYLKIRLHYQLKLSRNVNLLPVLLIILIALTAKIASNTLPQCPYMAKIPQYPIFTQIEPKYHVTST